MCCKLFGCTPIIYAREIYSTLTFLNVRSTLEIYNFLLGKFSVSLFTLEMKYIHKGPFSSVFWEHLEPHFAIISIYAVYKASTIYKIANYLFEVTDGDDDYNAVVVATDTAASNERQETKDTERQQNKNTNKH